MLNIYEEILKLQKANESFAVTSILKSKGSTPRHIGKMIVKRDGGIIGTIGGGLAESYVITEAREAIRHGLSTIVEYRLDSEAQGGIQMMCGGTLTVFIEVMAKSPTLMLLGAGHVGQALARLGDTLGYRVVVVDERPEFANARLYPMAAETHSAPDILNAFAEAKVDGDTHIIIATTDSDLRCLRAALKTDAAYIGMIGSGRKVAKMLKMLRDEGVAGTENVHAPVGLDIGAETPEEIAVSIFAEIMRERSGASGHSLREIKLGRLKQAAAEKTHEEGKPRQEEPPTKETTDDNHR